MLIKISSEKLGDILENEHHNDVTGEHVYTEYVDGKEHHLYGYEERRKSSKPSSATSSWQSVWAMASLTMPPTTASPTRAKN